MILTENVSLPEKLLSSPVLSRLTVLDNMEEGRVIFRCLVPRSACALEVSLLLAADFEATERIPAVYSGISEGRDVFEVSLELSRGLYYFTYSVATPEGERFVHSVGDELHGELREREELCGRFQLMLCKKGLPDRTSLQGSAMYHIFVDRFRRSGRCEIRLDANFDPDWESGIPEYGQYPGDEVPNNTFFGGDLYGIAEKLPYLVSLGIDTIYLSPIFSAYSNHRYDTADYTKVDPAVGGEEGFDFLVKEAKRHNIKLVLDGVFNHVGSESVYFGGSLYGKNGAAVDPDSPYRDWFFFEEYPHKYKSWWGVKTLPKLNGESPAVRELIYGDGGVVPERIKRGAGGFRLDVADELSNELLDGIKKASFEASEDSFIIGEVWEDASNKIAYGKRRRYFTEGQLDSVMNYPLRTAIIEFVKYSDAASLARTLGTLIAHYPERVLHSLMNFLGTHDTERILTVLAGESGEGKSGDELALMRLSDPQYKEGRRMLVLAFALLSVCPGVPCVYYGDEAGMQGYRDPFCRMPFPWGREDEALTREFTKILAYRKAHPEIISGKTEIAYAIGGSFAVRRFKDGRATVGLFNSAREPAVFALGAVCKDGEGRIYKDTVTLEGTSYIYLEEIQ